MDKKNVLVTGGAGFIGSFLCEALLREGNRVICVDNLSTGNLLNIDGLLRNPDFQFLKADITKELNLEDFRELDSFKVKFLGVQEIYHLAMPTTIHDYEQFRKAAALCMSVGTVNMLELAVKYRSRVVFASSATVYGAQTTDVPISEDTLGVLDHLNPRGSFNEGKRFSETLIATYRDVHGISTRIARIFRTYGPRMPLFHGHQIPDFMVNILDGEPVRIMGDAQTTTSLAYVTDVVDGLLRLMRADDQVVLVNMGSDQRVSMSDVAQKIMTMAGMTVPVVYERPSAHMVPLGLPSLKRAREALGWIPLVRLDDGLERTLEYIRANKILLTQR